MSNTFTFKKNIPADLSEPPRLGQLIAKYHFKQLNHVHDDWYFIGFYNCGIHFQGWEVARDKYNSLVSVK
jgi:hypothetical protein